MPPPRAHVYGPVPPVAWKVTARYPTPTSPLCTGIELIASSAAAGDTSGLGLGATGDAVGGLLEGLASGDAWLDVGLFIVQAARNRATPAINAQVRPVPFIFPVRV